MGGAQGAFFFFLFFKEALPLSDGWFALGLWTTLWKTMPRAKSGS